MGYGVTLGVTGSFGGIGAQDYGVMFPKTYIVLIVECAPQNYVIPDCGADNVNAHHEKGCQ